MLLTNIGVMPTGMLHLWDLLYLLIEYHGFEFIVRLFICCYATEYIKPFINKSL